MTPPHKPCFLWWPLDPGIHPRHFMDPSGPSICTNQVQDLDMDGRDLMTIQRKLKNATNHLTHQPSSFWWPLKPESHPWYFKDPGSPNIGTNNVQDLDMDRRELMIFQRKLRNAANHVQ